MIKIIAISELPLASFSKQVLVLILSYENEISFTCKLNSFSYEWLCTRPCFEREALGNSEMVYYNYYKIRKCEHIICASLIHVFHYLPWTRNAAM